ncbi:fluoride efflux transporter CrcB [Marinobacter sp. 1Y8]
MSIALSMLAISLGAAIGANLRWLLSLWLNTNGAVVPMGTLIANLSGAWLVGVLISYFSSASHLGPEWRLFAVTGLCGALTTFSTFSLEMFGALQSDRWLAAATGMSLHVFGSLLMTGLGIYSFHVFRGG